MKEANLFPFKQTKQRTYFVYFWTRHPLMMPGYATKPWHLTGRSVQPFQITLTEANPSTKSTLRMEALRPWDGSKVNLSHTCITHAAWTPLIYHWAKILLAIQSNLSYSALPFSIWPPLPALSHNCSMNQSDNIALVVFSVPRTPVCSPEMLIWHHSVNLMWDPIPCTTPPQRTTTKDDYLGNIRAYCSPGTTFN